MKTTSASVPTSTVLQVIQTKIMRFVKWAMVP